jgi:predicted RNase H-like HicB family nuclease
MLAGSREMAYLVISRHQPEVMPTLDFTAIMKKVEKQFVALCPEIDIVSQGPTIERAMENLREAAELYLEEMEPPEGIGFGELLVTHFEVVS